MGTIYFAQYPLLSLILRANKKSYVQHIFDARGDGGADSAPAGVEVPELGGGPPAPELS